MEKETPAWRGEQIFLSIIKYGASAAVLVASIGYPAVYVHFISLQIPIQFIPYKLALKAGLLPALLLAWLVLYIILARNWGKAFNSMLLPFLMLMPLLFVPLTIMIIGWVSGFALLSYGIARLVTMALPWSLRDSQLWWIALGLFALYILVALLFLYRSSRSQEYRKARQFMRQSWADLVNPQFTHFEYEDLKDEMLFFAFFGPIFFGLTYVGYLYAIRFVFSFFIFSLSFLKSIWLLGFACGILLSLVSGLFVSMPLLRSEKILIRTKGFVIVTINLLCLFVFYTSVYALYLYPIIPQSIGGGKPVPVVVWVKESNLLPAFQPELPNVSFKKEKNHIRVEGLYLVYVDSEIMILTDKLHLPAKGIVFPRGIFEAIAARE